MLNLNKALLDLIMAGLHGKSIRAGGWLWALECAWLLLAGQPRKTSLGFAFCLLCESGNPKWCRTRHFLLTGSKRQALLFSPSEAARHGQEILIRTSSFVTTRCLALSPRPKVTWCSLAQRGPRTRLTDWNRGSCSLAVSVSPVTGTLRKESKLPARSLCTRPSDMYQKRWQFFWGVSFESEGKRIPYDTLSNTHPCNKKEHLRTGLDFHKYYFDLQQAQTTVAAEIGETGGCQLHQVKKRPWTSQKKGRNKNTSPSFWGGESWVNGPFGGCLQGLPRLPL